MKKNALSNELASFLKKAAKRFNGKYTQSLSNFYVNDKSGYETKMKVTLSTFFLAYNGCNILIPYDPKTTFKEYLMCTHYLVLEEYLRMIKREKDISMYLPEGNWSILNLVSLISDKVRKLVDEFPKSQYVKYMTIFYDASKDEKAAIKKYGTSKVNAAYAYYYKLLREFFP